VADINRAAGGFGVQSRYYDNEILLDGSYQVISVTLDKDSRDTDNSPITTLRKGLLLAKRSDGKYEPLSTADGFLNGATPTQFIHDVVVLGREVLMTTVEIKGVKKYFDARDQILPAYWTCFLREAFCFYNNKSNVALTEEQLGKLSARIKLVPSNLALHYKDSGYLRNVRSVQNIATI